MAEKRTRKITVFNTTGVPRTLNRTGAFIFPGETREADPDDPFTQALLNKGYLITTEG